MEYTTQTSVFVTDEFVGFHSWPKAPKDVGYLADTHRHLFKIRIDVAVSGDDRQIEYHTLKRELRRRLQGAVPTTEEGEFIFLSLSCEQIARSILEAVHGLYPDQGYYQIEVSEDGENGSVVTSRGI